MPLKRRHPVHRAIRTNILVGLLLLTPIATTIVVLNLLLRLATGWMPSFLASFLEGIRPLYLQRLVILLITFLLLFLVGWLGRNLIGRRLYRYGEWLLARIPLVRDVYQSASRILNALFSQRKTLFKEAVVIQYPRPGLYSIAFVTAELPASMAQTATGHPPDGPWVALFIPTTPNPTSGILICAPRSETIPLKLPIQEALTFVMSAGAVIQRDDAGGTNLLDRIDEWLRSEIDSETSHDTDC